MFRPFLWNHCNFCFVICSFINDDKHALAKLEDLEYYPRPIRSTVLECLSASNIKKNIPYIKNKLNALEPLICASALKNCPVRQPLRHSPDFAYFSALSFAARPAASISPPRHYLVPCNLCPLPHPNPNLPVIQLHRYSTPSILPSSLLVLEKEMAFLCPITAQSLASELRSADL